MSRGDLETLRQAQERARGRHAIESTGPVQVAKAFQPLPRQTADDVQRREKAERERLDREAAARWSEIQPAIGERYRGCTLESFVATTERQQRVKAIVTQFVADMPANLAAGTNLVLFGTVGTGKDHLLVAALREAVRAGTTARYISGMDLWAQMRGAFADDKNESSVLRDLTRCDVLAISDPIPPFGTLTDFQTQVLYRIVDARYRARKPTWMTINVADGEQAATKLGAANVDRLKDHAVMVRCEWDSYRQAKR